MYLLAASSRGRNAHRQQVASGGALAFWIESVVKPGDAGVYKRVRPQRGFAAIRGGAGDSVADCDAVQKMGAAWYTANAQAPVEIDMQILGGFSHEGRGMDAFLNYDRFTSRSTGAVTARVWLFPMPMVLSITA